VTAACARAAAAPPPGRSVPGPDSVTHTVPERQIGGVS
jgi:hypothetical protein